MLILEETLRIANSPVRLLQLGLTTSEAEVLYWVAHGKTNQEMSIILNKTLNMIKKHVVNMGTDTRLMAALQAAETLELKAVEPERLRALRESASEDEHPGR